MVLYDEWLIKKKETVKKDIIDYNEDDCISTYQLRNFLIKYKPENINFFVKSEEEKEKKSKEKSWEITSSELIKDLKKILNKDKRTIVDDLIDLVGFHRREQKPEYHFFYDRLEKDHLELEDDKSCIGNCVLKSNKPIIEEKSLIFKYEFSDQEYKIKKGDDAYSFFDTRSLGKVEELSYTSMDKNILVIRIRKIAFKR